MAAKLTGLFETRRDAEMAVERLVQEHGVDRSLVLIAPVGDANSAGEQTAGADSYAGAPGTGERSDAKLTGSIEVSVDVQDDGTARTIRDAFAEFGAHDIGRG
jgi:hypothetical protein